MMGAGSAASVAVYYMPQRLMEIIEMPIRSFTSTAMPLLSAAANQGDDEKVAYIMKKYAGMLILALLPVCIAGFLGAGLIIELVGGKKIQWFGSYNCLQDIYDICHVTPCRPFFWVLHWI